MRAGIDSVKPDVHMAAFVEAAVGRQISEIIVGKAARHLGIAAAQLDARIRTYQRGLGSAGKTAE